MPSAGPILDGDLLRAFVAFADTLNFTHAARRVGLSQPALFERVRRLGDELGAPLYERTGKQLRLTDRGLRVAAHARDAVARAEAFARDLRGEPQRESVTLAAGEGAFLYLLGPALARFAAEGASLRLLTLGAPSACAAVRAGDAHLAVGVLDLVPPELVARDVLRTPLCVAMPRRHRLARRRSLRLMDLAGERLVLPPAGRSHRDLIGRAIARLGHEVDPPIEADGWPLMLQFAALGLGVAVVNGICAPPRGVILRPVPELGTVCYRLVTRRGAELPPAAERLAARIVEIGKGAARAG
ncbi:LysR family transcriptional regulator [Sorangium sp. So ce381]|uniref:LysR family transcriptional regulator n=1 Tax=Sorangium sp. So ce381 TaxID=3133307 RepID=UPI003F5B8B05